MFRNFMELRNLKEVLEGLVEQKVTIILVSGQRLTVEVDAVVDNLLVASIDGKILFIDIECICVVVTCCEEVLESLFDRKRSRRRMEEEEDRCGLKGKEFFGNVSREHEEESRSREKFDF
jgi:hypothetical protein